MRMNIYAVLLDYEENPIKATGKLDLTLGSMAINSLNAILEHEKTLDAESKIHRATLSIDIQASVKSGESIDIDVKDVALIMKMMNYSYGPLPLHRAYEILDPKAKEIASNA